MKTSGNKYENMLLVNDNIEALTFTHNGEYITFINNQNQIASAIQQCSTAFIEVFPNPTLLSGSPAHSIVFTDTFRVQGVTHRVYEMVELVVNQGQVYVIDYIADPQKYLLYLPIIQEMINSFEFIS